MKKTPYNQISNYASGSTVQISSEVSDNASTALPDLSAPFGAPKEPTVSKEPSVPNTECLNLFCVASAAGDLSKKFECYKKYGLTSYLGACSINLVTHNSYVTKSSNSLDVNLHSKFESFASERKLKLPVEYFSEIKAPLGASPLYFKGEQMSQALYNESMAGTSYLLTVNSIWKEEASSQHTISNDSYISTNKYVASKIFDNDIQFINREQNCELDIIVSLDENNINIENYIPFKVSRDYISSDSSEGFEDWSFLDQKRPYDSLVRENIFELLKDLETFGSEHGVLDIEDIQGSSASERGFSPNPFDGLEEHLFSSEINKTYTTRLRLEQRIKKFYGLKNLSKTQSDHQGNLNDGVWSSLLKIEERIDVQLFRLKWVSSIAQARQALKHKHIGIINRKDRVINTLANWVPKEPDRIPKVSNWVLKIPDRAATLANSLPGDRGGG